MYQLSLKEEADEEGQQYEVDEILQKGSTGQEVYYLVKWKALRQDQATWEPKSKLKGCQEAIEEFESLIKEIQQNSQYQLIIQEEAINNSNNVEDQKDVQKCGSERFRKFRRKQFNSELIKKKTSQTECKGSKIINKKMAHHKIHIPMKKQDSQKLKPQKKEQQKIKIQEQEYLIQKSSSQSSLIQFLKNDKFFCSQAKTQTRLEHFNIRQQYQQALENVEQRNKIAIHLKDYSQATSTLVKNIERKEKMKIQTQTQKNNKARYREQVSQAREIVAQQINNPPTKDIHNKFNFQEHQHSYLQQSPQLVQSYDRYITCDKMLFQYKSLILQMLKKKIYNPKMDTFSHKCQYIDIFKSYQLMQMAKQQTKKIKNCSQEDIQAQPYPFSTVFTIKQFNNPQLQILLLKSSYSWILGVNCNYGKGYQNVETIKAKNVSSSELRNTPNKIERQKRQQTAKPKQYIISHKQSESEADLWYWNINDIPQVYWDIVVEKMMSLNKSIIQRLNAKVMSSKGHKQ